MVITSNVVFLFASAPRHITSVSTQTSARNKHVIQIAPSASHCHRSKDPEKT